jgi:Ssl1-like
MATPAAAGNVQQHAWEGDYKQRSWAKLADGDGIKVL